MSARDEEPADPADPTYPDRPSAHRNKPEDHTTDQTAAEPERVGNTDPASILERVTIDDSQALAAPTLDTDGAIPSGELPSFETATEIDTTGWSEDQASAEILDAFRAAHDPTPQDATPLDASPPVVTQPDGHTPSDPHGRFDRLRVPTQDEIQEAVQGTPTLALEAQPVQDPPTLVDDTAPVGTPSSSELRRIVERTAIVTDPAAARAGRVEGGSNRQPVQENVEMSEEPVIEPARSAAVDPASRSEPAPEGDQPWSPAPASLPFDMRVPDRVFDPTEPVRTGPPTGLVVVAAVLAVLAIALAGVLVWRTL